MAPLTDAMGFIDDEQGDIRLVKRIHRFFFSQLLGREKDELHVPLLDACPVFADLLSRP